MVPRSPRLYRLFVEPHSRPRVHSVHWTFSPSTSPLRASRKLRWTWLYLDGKRVGFCLGVGLYDLAVYYLA